MNESNNSIKVAKGPVLTGISSDTQLMTEISEEFSLPDYIPEVRRILYTRAIPLPEGKFISEKDNGTGVDFDGTVAYTVIYTDDEGALRSTSLSTAYEDTFTLPGHPDDVFIDTVVDNTSCRATAPRKLIIKTRLKSRALAFSDETINENISPRSLSDEMYIERKLKTVDSLSLRSFSMQNIKLSDKLDVPDGEDIVPIMCDASLVLSDCKAKNGSISVRGSATVNCLCQGTNGEIMLTKTLPVYEEPSADGITSSDRVRCCGRCISLSISNDSSNNSSLFFDLSCEIEGEYYRNSENPLTEDCYSTKYKTDTEYRSVDVYSLADARLHTVEINDKFKKKDSDVDTLVDVIYDISADRTETVNGKLITTGKICSTVIGKTKEKEGRDPEYVTESYDVPFRLDIPVDCEYIIPRASFTLSSPNARYENDKFCIDAELVCSVALFKKNEVRILKSASINKDEEYKRDASCVRVFFPKDCDILWEVAKKFHTTERKIIEENGLPTKSLEGVKSIII